LYIEKAKERYDDMMKTRCMSCKKDLSSYIQNKNNINPANNIYYTKIPVTQEGNPIPEHVLCKECAFSVKSEIYYTLKTDRTKMKAKYTPINCKICKVKHSLETKLLRVIFKNEDGQCCNLL
jgi:hypothetical protein